MPKALDLEKVGIGSCSLLIYLDRSQPLPCLSSFFGDLNHSLLAESADLTPMASKKKPGLPLGIQADGIAGLPVARIAGTDDAQLNADSPRHETAP